jgi:hypothetical protein
LERTDNRLDNVNGEGTYVSTLGNFFLYDFTEFRMVCVYGWGVSGGLGMYDIREVYSKTELESCRYVTETFEKVGLAKGGFPCLWFIGS